MQKRKISINDLARELGMSKTTVSLVLNGKGDANKIKKETQERIQALAKERGYVASKLAKGLSLGRTETLGLIVPNIADDFYARVAHQMELLARKSGYDVLYASSYEDPKTEKRLIQSMMQRGVDGLILASCQQIPNTIQRLVNQNFPLVLIDRHYPEISTSYVIVNNKDGVKDAVSHLLENGFEELAFMTIKSPLEAMIQRRHGFEEALQNRGKDLVSHIWEVDQANYKAQVCEIMGKLPFKNKGAIVFSTHYLAVAGFSALQEMEQGTQYQLGLLSFGEKELFPMLSPALSSITQPVDEMAHRAVAILLEQIENKGYPVTTDILSLIYNWRDSSQQKHINVEQIIQ